MPGDVDSLNERYPSLYVKTSSNRSVYFEVQAGWFDLLVELSEQLVEILAKHPRVMFRPEQVKSKYGSLRFYFDVFADTRYPWTGAPWTGVVRAAEEEVQAAIDAATAKSETICEFCGGRGQLRGPHWSVHTICDACNEKYWPSAPATGDSS